MLALSSIIEEICTILRRIASAAIHCPIIGKECGKMIQQCMQVWIDAIGPLATYIAPIEDGRLYPLGINIENGQMITYAWLKNYSGEFVVSMSQYRNEFHPEQFSQQYLAFQVQFVRNTLMIPQRTFG